ncbi:hypothetical protein [Sphingomonas trueperi]|uniref:hypothetical protein n=1 Tax=Sphingomonas trueperi TaxID=53317 RepID=UPI000EAF9952
MSAEEANTGREIIGKAIAALDEGYSVLIRLRGRGRGIKAVKIVPDSLSFRVDEADGFSCDVAFSAVEHVAYSKDAGGEKGFNMENLT